MEGWLFGGMAVCGGMMCGGVALCGGMAVCGGVAVCGGMAPAGADNKTWYLSRFRSLLTASMVLVGRRGHSVSD